jgi:hypothetical protein
MSNILKRPSAYFPLIMSAAALAIVVAHVARFGIEPQPDEGTAAHLWQLLMAAQLPVIAFFAIKWLPQAPKQGLVVLALQCAAIIAAAAPVIILEF